MRQPILVVLVAGALASLAVAGAALGLTHPPHRVISVEMPAPLPSDDVLAVLPAADSDLLVWRPPVLARRRSVHLRGAVKVVRVVRVVRIVKVVRVRVAASAKADRTRPGWRHHHRGGGR